MPLRIRAAVLAFAVAVNLDFGIWKSSGGGLPKAGAKKIWREQQKMKDKKEEKENDRRYENIP